MDTLGIKKMSADDCANMTLDKVFSGKEIKGEKFEFKSLKGKKVLIVNTASKCGFTPQFKELEELHQKYGNNLIVIGFPSNDFGAQDPGSNSDIKQFCELNYGVTFLMMEKSSVKGKEKNDVYKWLSDWPAP